MFFRQAVGAPEPSRSVASSCQTPARTRIIIVDASDPLLFRYALADRSGFGAALPSLGTNGSDRVWSVAVDGAAVDVAFDAADGDIADAYDAHSDVLTGLGGHTLIVHGTIAVEAELVGVFGGLGDLDSDDKVSDVDPDGTPATDPENDVDPDGGAASDPDSGNAGDTSDVDPDGGAAHPTGDKVADVDPDGTPAAGGNVGEGREGSAKRPGKNVKALVHGALKGEGRRAIVNVPFSLVADGSFHREVVLGADDIASVGDGDVMPLDLHLSASELLDTDRLAELEAVAKDAVAKDDEATVIVPVPQKATAEAATVKVQGSIKKPTHVVDGTSRIRVSGDLRR